MVKEIARNRDREHLPHDISRKAQLFAIEGMPVVSIAPGNVP